MEGEVDARPPDAKKAKLDSDGTKEDNITNSGDEKKISVNKDVDKSNDHSDNGKEQSLCKHGGNQREVDVGMTEYISSLPGFSGVIKQRYSDFLVNEVSERGEVVTLNSLDLPSPLAETQTAAPDLVAGALARELLSEADIEALSDLLKSKDNAKHVTIEVADDKALRTRIHSAIAKGFPGLETNTVEKEGKKLIQVKITTNKGSGLHNWPKGRGDYCRFVLYKENKDTMDTISLLAGRLRVKSGTFQYAGTKDKRAKTCQEVTVYRVTPEKLKDANQKLRNIVTGNYSYVSKPIRLGSLQGNKFTIILRSVTGREDDIEAGMVSMRDVGFINYYGMQRFGTSSIPSHHIGRALLLGDWKTAVELILKPRDGDEREVDAARKLWWESKDSQKALQRFPKFCYIERSVLHGLCDRPTDYMGALNKIARNTRLLYVHAYQSYVWNAVVSHRIKEHGLKPILGDLVMPAGTDSAMDEGGERRPEEKCKPVMLEDTNIGDYSIYDVVLPLVGYDSVYPGNDVQNLYRQLLEKDGLNYEDMRRKQKDFSLSGDYRHLVIKPKDVSWNFHRYDDPHLPLVLSDWERMNESAEPPGKQTGGSQLAVELQLTLPSSCYATMALRELLKIDTSSSHQASLNVS